MDLFGAASMGVDPKTGSYLTKEQRVAMFRASRGMGGAGNGGAKVPGSGNKYRVDPKSSIVRAKKDVSIVETLKKDYTQPDEATVDRLTLLERQVARNTAAIKALGDYLHKYAINNLKYEREKLSKQRKEQAEKIRTKREELIENLSTMAAGAAKTVGKFAGDTFKKAKGFLDKLRDAVVLLGGAWIIDNLPAIEAAWKQLEDIFKNFPKTMEEVGAQAKGAGALINKMLQKGFDAVTSFGRKVGDTIGWIKRKGTNLIKKVFSSVKNFVVKLVTRGVDAVKDALKGGVDAADAAKDTARNARRGSAFADGTKGALGAADDVARAALPPASGGRTPTPRGNSLGNMTRSIADFLGGARDKVMGGIRNIKTTVGDSLKGMVSGKPKTAAVRANWLMDALKPLADVPGLSFLGKQISKLAPMLRGATGIPGLGFAIDLAINKGLDGRDWTEAIVGALGSQLGSGLGMAAGAKVGAGVGGVIGQVAIPIPGIGFGIGAGIGGALGTFIGALVGGQIGDELALRGKEAVTGEERTSKPTFMTGVFDAIGGAFNMSGADAAETVSNISATPTAAKFDGLSTPAGMELTEAAYGSDVQFIDMPPEVIDMTTAPAINPEVQMSDAEDLTTFATRDVDMDDYRILTANEYQLAF